MIGASFLVQKTGLFHLRFLTLGFSHSVVFGVPRFCSILIVISTTKGCLKWDLDQNSHLHSNRRIWFPRFLRGGPTMSHSDNYLNSHVSWSYVDGAYRSTAPRFPGEPSAASPQLLCFRCMFVGTQPLTTACLSVCLSALLSAPLTAGGGKIQGAPTPRIPACLLYTSPSPRD